MTHVLSPLLSLRSEQMRLSELKAEFEQCRQKDEELNKEASMNKVLHFH